MAKHSIADRLICGTVFSSLYLSSAFAGSVSLSGKVTDKGVGLPGVTVYLASTRSLSTTTASDGSWALSGTTSGISNRSLDSRSAFTGGHLRMEGGHLQLSLSGYDLMGRPLPCKGPLSTNRIPSEAAARTTAAVPDTLVYIYNRSEFLRDTITDPNLTGIVRKYDYLWKASNICGYLTDPRDGELYKTTTIGSQVWMAENLHYAGSDTTVGACSSGEKCDSRFYTWAEAMSLDDSCNTKSCAALLDSNTMGVCPIGWHVPRESEWDVLKKRVGSTDITSTSYKSIRGWSSIGGNDYFGFCAPPAGILSKSGSPSSTSEASYWSTHEYSPTSSIGGLSLVSTSSYVYSGGGDKMDRQTLRCLKDTPLETSRKDSTLTELSTDVGFFTEKISSSKFSYTDSVPTGTKELRVHAVPSTPIDVWQITYNGSRSNVVPLRGAISNTIEVVVTNTNGNTQTYLINVYTQKSIPWQKNISFGTVTDLANQSYKTVTIGSQTWMAENLNYAGSGMTIGSCYKDSLGLCAKYGRMYTWAEAMGIDTSFNHKTWKDWKPNHQGICPTGWHVPIESEWKKLTDTILVPSNAANQLKSTNGWHSNNGMDTYGFRALPGGYYYSGWSGEGDYSRWWYATQEGLISDPQERLYALAAGLSSSSSSTSYGYGIRKDQPSSLRCLKN